MKDDIQQFFKREVLPYVPDAWLEQSSKKVGYEINFTKYFYEYKPLRHLKEIKHDIFRLEKTRQNINSAITKGTDPKVKMKESGIQWVGKIPKHWKIAPLFTKLFQQKKINEVFLERNVLSLSYGKIVKRDINTNFGLLPKSFGTYQIVDPEDIILRLTDLQNDKKSLRVGYVGQRGIITSAYLCLKAIGIYPRYAYLLLHHYDIMKVFYNFGAGVRQSMSFDDLRRFPLVLPPISEQKKIVSYIDHKILQVDKAIQSFNEEVEILKEYRKSLVSTVVTGKANTDDFKD